MSLEQRISELNETLQEAGESYMEKLAEVQNLQNRLSNQVRPLIDEMLYGHVLITKAAYLSTGAKNGGFAK